MAAPGPPARGVASPQPREQHPDDARGRAERGEGLERLDGRHGRSGIRARPPSVVTTSQRRAGGIRARQRDPARCPADRSTRAPTDGPTTRVALPGSPTRLAMVTLTRVEGRISGAGGVLQANADPRAEGRARGDRGPDEVADPARGGLLGAVPRDVRQGGADGVEARWGRAPVGTLPIPVPQRGLARADVLRTEARDRGRARRMATPRWTARPDRARSPRRGTRRRPGRRAPPTAPSRLPSGGAIRSTTSTLLAFQRFLPGTGSEADDVAAVRHWVARVVGPVPGERAPSPSGRCASISRFQRLPERSWISTATTLASLSRTAIRATSREPSALGLNCRVDWKPVTIGGGVGNANGARNTPSPTTNNTSMPTATRGRVRDGLTIRRRRSAGAVPEADVEAKPPDRGSRERELGRARGAEPVDAPDLRSDAPARPEEDPAAAHRLQARRRPVRLEIPPCLPVVDRGEVDHDRRDPLGQPAARAMEAVAVRRGDDDDAPRREPGPGGREAGPGVLQVLEDVGDGDEIEGALRWLVRASDLGAQTVGDAELREPSLGDPDRLRGQVDADARKAALGEPLEQEPRSAADVEDPPPGAGVPVDRVEHQRDPALEMPVALLDRDESRSEAVVVPLDVLESFAHGRLAHFAERGVVVARRRNTWREGLAVQSSRNRPALQAR